jgi:hypothetical protein
MASVFSNNDYGGPGRECNFSTKTKIGNALGSSVPRHIPGTQDRERRYRTPDGRGGRHEGNWMLEHTFCSRRRLLFLGIVIALELQEPAYRMFGRDYPRKSRDDPRQCSGAMTHSFQEHSLYWPLPLILGCQLLSNRVIFANARYSRVLCTLPAMVRCIARICSQEDEGTSR